MTLAEQFKAKRRKDYSDPFELLELILSVDPESEMQRVDDTVEILFSDGSTHKLGEKQQ